MDAAKEWGVPPYEIAGGEKIIWFIRYQVRRGFELNKVQQETEEANV